MRGGRREREREGRGGGELSALAGKGEVAAQLPFFLRPVDEFFIYFSSYFLYLLVLFCSHKGCVSLLY